ncbi:MAG TPA: diversity-generating retroelement protein Avd [Treponemataceae bacterium]|nr:diversity-generating retroelement protein Avd [Treponemataceae bacterium]
MKIYQKWEDMTIYLYTAIRQYPKSERFTLAANTIQAAITAGTAITRATAIPSEAAKRREIDKADEALAELKILVRIGMKLEFLPIKRYEILSGQLTEIGKMVGGWIRSIKK